MARVCELCGKGAMKGNAVARTGTRGYVKGRSLRNFKPNLRKVKVEIGGRPKTMRICAQCLKSRVKKVKV
jgi:large subunit ribosomal protein L28